MTETASRMRLRRPDFFTDQWSAAIEPRVYATPSIPVFLSESESRSAGRGRAEGSRGCQGSRCSVREFSRECLDAVSRQEASSGSFDYVGCRHFTEAAARRFAQYDRGGGRRALRVQCILKAAITPILRPPYDLQR